MKPDPNQSTGKRVHPVGAILRYLSNLPASRTTILTGQYPQRWKIASYLAHRKVNIQRGLAQWLDPRSLQHAGYAAGHFGKWHMGGQRVVNDAPAITDYGFGASMTNFEGMGPKLLPLTLKPGAEKPGWICNIP